MVRNRENFNGSRIDYVPFADNHGFHFVIAALSYQVYKNVWIIPNVKLAMYNDPEGGEKADNDFYGNLTLYFKF